VTTPPPIPSPRPRPSRPRPSPRPTPVEPARAPAAILLDWPGEASGPGLVARATLLALLALWTASFLRAGMDAERLMGSFLHLVNLPFHEAGHVFLSPFGRFLTVLGGSLFQVAVPLLCAGVFLVKNRDPFAASVATWWAGQSLLDLAPYVADARALALPLLGGRTGAEVEGHDWEYLLATLGLLQRDVALGRLCFGLGAVLMLASLGWGGLALWRKRTEVA
jgi:hypothetical protein